MSNKHIAMVFGGIVGLSGAVAAGQWSDNAAPIQMAMYSVLILGLLFMGFWSDKSRPRFWTGMSLVVLLHGVVMYFIRSYFPFSPIFFIVPLGVVEIIVLAIPLLKVLGY